VLLSGGGVSAYPFQKKVRAAAFSVRGAVPAPLLAAVWAEAPEYAFYAPVLFSDSGGFGAGA